MCVEEKLIFKHMKYFTLEQKIYRICFQESYILFESICYEIKDKYLILLRNTAIKICLEMIAVLMSKTE